MALRLTIAHRSRPKSGEQENGDIALVRQEGAHTLLAVVDALGHGPVAARVASDAARCLEQQSLSGGVGPVVDALHAALRNGRGAAVMLGLFDGHTLHCAGVGNVELRSRGTKVPVIPTPGILGQSMRSLRTASAPLQHGDRLVFFSDGLSFRLDLEPTRSLPPGEACALLMERYARTTDDATVLVADVETV
ncbi:SpoIIE family protein phosphatase [Pyxidicoccus xibeiensis]|uniref:SpoIIE family protein phosphatase n=1 Tax=Pyxidicoccus xibeiensis TaxID=2906759 RepID=UPI0020A7A8E2|nr:SpoIIE family protein phosphatase [Pyxidicoccus xibeiensis]MCP3141086.1 serine/threonine-protein phosphatase [Pyxidicoccus xibeiensis]